APPSPDYVPGPEEPEQAPPLPEFVLETVYPKFMPLEDDVLPSEEQPLSIDVSPTADSPRYIPESNPKEDPKEDEDEDPEEDPADYPTYRDEDNDEAKEPSRDEADDEEEDEDDKEEEEHPALADSVPPHVHRVMARMSIRDQPPTPFWSEVEIERLLAIPTPPPSPLTPLSSPLPHIPSPLLPISQPLPISSPPPLAGPTYPLGYRAAMIRLRSESPSTSHPLP
ncbi:hypothetical protein Tco_1020757, partial [Tanacetum coccineum]